MSDTFGEVRTTHGRARRRCVSKPQSIDWDAVERDYRTGNLTLRELGTKHGCAHTAIANRAKRGTWSRDLGKAVRRATSAKLIEQAVTTAVNSAEHAVTTTVLAAAELNKQVILGHRTELREARSIAVDMLAELRIGVSLAKHEEILTLIMAGKDPTPEQEAKTRIAVNRALGLGGRVSSIKALADALTKLHAAERVAFGIDGASEAPPELAEQLAAFISQIHESRAGRLPIAPQALKR